MNKIVPLTGKDFNSDMSLNGALADAKAVVVLFFRDSCGHCKHFKPTFFQVAQNNTDGGIVYATLDINPQDPEEAQQYRALQKYMSQGPFQLPGVPYMVGYHKGKYVASFLDDRTAQNVVGFAKTVAQGSKYVQEAGGASAAGGSIAAVRKGAVEMKATAFRPDMTLKDPWNKGNCVILFYMDGCGHCRHFKPIFDQAAAEEDPRVCKYFKVNIDPETKADQVSYFMLDQYMKEPEAPFQVDGVPHVVSYSQGKFFSNFGGDRTKEDVMAFGRSIGKVKATRR